jgi:hypothetical protein
MIAEAISVALLLGAFWHLSRPQQSVEPVSESPPPPA